jgi:hypothetical protein
MVLNVKRIDLGNGKSVSVDDEDYEFLSSEKWRFSPLGYAVRTVKCADGNHRMEYMHRRILGLTFGDKRRCDHRDEDKLNNCRANLRICTNAQNMWNCGVRKTNKTRLKGVTFRKDTGKWIARIWTNGICNRLGNFDSAEAASEAYKTAAVALHGEFAKFD